MILCGFLFLSTNLSLPQWMELHYRSGHLFNAYLLISFCCNRAFVPCKTCTALIFFSAFNSFAIKLWLFLSTTFISSAFIHLPYHLYTSFTQSPETRDSAQKEDDIVDADETISLLK